MKIAAIRGFHLAYDLSVPHGNSGGAIRRREVVLIELRADNGLSGWGETAFSCASVGVNIRQVLAPLLLGSDPSLRLPHWRRMMATRGYDRRGVAMMAISAVDIALHDLVAREQGISIARLLGGAQRDYVPAYASGPYLATQGDPYGDFPRQVDTLLERGFHAIKPRIGSGVARDIRAMEALRAQAGSAIELMADVNGGYSPSSAVVALDAMKGLNLTFIEEPVEVEDRRGLAHIVRSQSTPVAAGESLADLSAFRDLLADTSVALVQPDMGVCGGFTGYIQAATLAEAARTPTMPHVWGGAVGFYASLQVAALLPSFQSVERPFPFIEYDVGENAVLGLCGNIPLEADGTVRVPQGPGIGVEVVPERFAPLIVDRWEVSA